MPNREAPLSTLSASDISLVVNLVVDRRDDDLGSNNISNSVSIPLNFLNLQSLTNPSFVSHTPEDFIPSYLSKNGSFSLS
jgi:hypothetical protein